ncbi:MAG: class I SAM-dependent methyltransferase [Ruminococcaceae bacterium]|nr:class I SAM-dependent methyltransferase [Oscillospiraceae bacterium]
MTDYDIIASVYDEFTDGFDHIDYLDRIFEKAPFLPKEGLAVDCGCGTGTLIAELTKRGYSCTGVDISPEMLELAAEKLDESGIEPHLICQPLEKIDLYGAYDLCFCSLDTLNHLTRKQLNSFIGRLINFTEPNGYFIFDVKTEALMKKNASLRVIDRETSTLILDGAFSRGVLTNYITVFSGDGQEYERYDSIVKETLYTREELKNLLKQKGFTPIKVFSFMGREIFIAQKRKAEI